MIRRPPRSTHCISSAASDVYKRQASKDLDWSAISNITGDLATTKKTIQTLNNRLNGMHSPKLQEQELMMQLLNRPPNQQSNGKLKNMGG